MYIRFFEDFTQAQFEPIKSFTLRDSLNPEVWDGYELDEDVKEQLITLGNDYFDNLNLGDVKLKDLIFTGSLANFNWSDYSDVDLHLIFDFSEVNEDVSLVRKYLDAVERAWKSQHDIKIKGYDVEIYCQSTDDDLTATGVYSLFEDKWSKKPTKENFKVDDESIKKKASVFMSDINDLEKKVNSGVEFSNIEDSFKKLWKKIKDARQSGLEKEGEFSTENLVFKLLRRNGYIQKFMDLKTKSYDKQFK